MIPSRVLDAGTGKEIGQPGRPSDANEPRHAHRHSTTLPCPRQVPPTGMRRFGRPLLDELPNSSQSSPEFEGLVFRTFQEDGPPFW